MITGVSFFRSQRQMSNQITEKYNYISLTSSLVELSRYYTTDNDEDRTKKNIYIHKKDDKYLGK